MTGELKIITNYSLCATCKGKCCNRLPGIYHPDDFRRIYNQDITVDLLVTIFKTGTVALDWWEGDPRSGQNQFYEEGDEEKEDDTLLDKCYYLRPKTINALNKLKDPAWRDNPCMNWSIGRGCSLDENHRPYGCRVLVPTEPINGEY
jgi:Fe-S-cluster containining protein